MINSNKDNLTSFKKKVIIYRSHKIKQLRNNIVTHIKKQKKQRISINVLQFSYFENLMLYLIGNK